jgi:hypothetical protein
MIPRFLYLTAAPCPEGRSPERLERLRKAIRRIAAAPAPTSQWSADHQLDWFLSLKMYAGFDDDAPELTEIRALAKGLMVTPRSHF